MNMLKTEKHQCFLPAKRNLLNIKYVITNYNTLILSCLYVYLFRYVNIFSRIFGEQENIV